MCKRKKNSGCLEPLSGVGKHSHYLNVFLLVDTLETYLKGSEYFLVICLHHVVISSVKYRAISSRKQLE